MKFLSFKNQLLGTLIDDTVIDMNAAYQTYGVKRLPLTMLDLIKSDYDRVFKVWQVAHLAKKEKNCCYSYSEIDVTPPLCDLRRNIFCLGKNYRDHVNEMSTSGTSDLPEDIIIFSKSPNCVIGHNDLIPSHNEITDSLDYEAEVAIIIGKGGYKISENQAWEHVFGYTAMNDVTARNLQRKHKQWFMGKNLDGFAPMGPVIVHRSSMPPINRIKISSFVNDELRQSSTLDNLIFSIPKIINKISMGITLFPGDIISTGTPAGVGAGFNPPKFLKSGDIVRIELSEVGTLINKVE